MSGNSINNVGTITNNAGGSIYKATPNHGSLAAGWYTIANQTGSRASAKFFVQDQEGGEHTAVHFYATHMYGQDNSNAITVVSDADYGGGCIQQIRIKEGGTYEGANLQVYLGKDNCGGVQAFMKDNFQDTGWELLDWYPGDATGGFTTAASVDLSVGPDDAARFTNGIRVKGQIDASSGAMRLPVGADAW